ncbi:hypothetical protein RUMCAL_03025, partial [Ruminococcus callidus ATCC 27760]
KVARRSLCGIAAGIQQNYRRQFRHCADIFEIFKIPVYIPPKLCYNIGQHRTKYQTLS